MLTATGQWRAEAQNLMRVAEGRKLSAERAESDPKVFTRIHMHFVVKGRGLSVKKAERAVNLSVENYCSASAMMAKTAEVTHSVEVVETGG